jgi:RNA polymerase sigma-70 factor (ECF subfamily)
VHSYCRKQVADHASDVTQEVFLAAWRSRDRFDPGSGSLGGWLMGITRFKVADHLRAHYRNQSVASGDLVDLGTTGDRPSAADPDMDLVATRILVAEALRRVDEPGSTWIRMAFVDGLSHSEIAETTGTPLGTVKSTIRRGLQRIRRDLEVFDAHA